VPRRDGHRPLAAEIAKGFGRPGATVIARYGQSQFLGEIGMLTGQSAYLTAVASSAGRILAVPVGQLRIVMANEPGLSDLILRAFLLRHSILMRRGAGLTLIGSRFDPDTRRLLEILARNRLVWTWLDPEGSHDAEASLQGPDVPVGDLPILVVPGGPLLRNPGSRTLLDALGMSGAEDSYPADARAVSLSLRNGLHEAGFDDGEIVQAKSVIIATGAHYNRLPLDRLAEFEGVGVYYAATQAEAQACGTGPVAIVGGGNSVGQAALFLSRSRSQVHVIIRADTLDASMSRYLVDRIEREPRITVSPHTQVTELIGTDQLEGVRIRRPGQAAESDLAVRGLFVFFGAKPRTEWLARRGCGPAHPGPEAPHRPPDVLVQQLVRRGADRAGGGRPRLRGPAPNRSLTARGAGPEGQGPHPAAAQCL
jgi:hypothetical protein